MLDAVPHQRDCRLAQLRDLVGDLLRVFPMLIIKPLTVFVRYDILSLDYFMERLRGR